MHLSTLSKRTQIVKIVTSVSCSSAALQSLLRSWYLQRFPTCAISEGHTCTGRWSSMDLWSYHTSCVTLIRSFNYFRFCYLDWYLIKPWTWISWGKWNVPGPLKGQGLPVLPAAYRDWEDKWQNWCESAQNGAVSTVPVKVTEGESSVPKSEGKWKVSLQQESGWPTECIWSSLEPWWTPAIISHTPELERVSSKIVTLK